MFREDERSEDRGDNGTEFCDNEFYHAIMTEDLGLIDAISKQHGSNSIIKIRDGGPAEVIHKGLAILPLHLAASYRKVRSLESLLAAGADPELRDRHGHNTLHQVIAHWPYILSRRPKPCSKFQSAIWSTEQRSEACLSALCNRGININDENLHVEGGGHQTALHLAVRYLALPAVHILASHGAELNAVDGSGMTALHMASGILNRDITARLIKLGANINVVVSQSGNTPLHLAALAADLRSDKTLEADISCITELLEQGAQPNMANKASKTPLHEACSEGKEAVVELLLKYGASVNQLTRAGENCLFLFLDKKANVRHSSLLDKLLSLTYPLLIYNQDGLLPCTLMLPQFAKQREQLVHLARQPRNLQDICKVNIYLHHNRGEREGLRHILPDKLYDFVFNYWRHTHNITFETEGDSVTLSSADGRIHTMLSL